MLAAVVTGFSSLAFRCNKAQRLYGAPDSNLRCAAVTVAPTMPSNTGTVDINLIAAVLRC